MARICVNGRYHQAEMGPLIFNASLYPAWDMPGYIKMAEAFMGESYAEINEENIDIGSKILNTLFSK